jgi:thiol-disulfide isomerase/thioredoxin
LLLLALAVSLPGCFALGRGRTGSTGNASTKPSGASGASTAPAQNIKPTPFWARDTESPRPESPNLALPNRSNPIKPNGAIATDYNGVLAGTLVDSFNRPVPKAYLQIVAVDGSMRPIEMTVENGWFTVPGLTPGRTYLLTARLFDGERRLAGRVQVIPPNPRVVIRLSEDLYSGTVPPPPTLDDLGHGTSGPKPARSEGLDDGWKLPDLRSTIPDRTGIDPPAPPLQAPSLPQPEDRIPSFNMENITSREGRPQDLTNPPAPPLINLPNPQSAPSPAETVPPPERDRSGANRFATPSGTKVPSCEFAGPHRLKNFALPDAFGSTWEFQQARGQLVLLDFWGTWCRPCLAAIPHLKRLHTEYGPYGLEVVSIACERGTDSQRTQRALDAIDKYKVDYRVLVAPEHESCPVQQRFGIQSYPTLILLDRQGNIRWRGDANGLGQLEALLKRDLRGGR